MPAPMPNITATLNESNSRSVVDAKRIKSLTLPSSCFFSSAFSSGFSMVTPLVSPIVPGATLDGMLSVSGPGASVEACAPILAVARKAAPVDAALQACGSTAMFRTNERSERPRSSPTHPLLSLPKVGAPASTKALKSFAWPRRPAAWRHVLPCVSSAPR